MRFIALILAFVFCFVGSAISEATPTDLEEEFIEIEEEDWGTIEIEFQRKVFITVDKDPEFIGDEMILVATLIDFQPEDKYTIRWQYSEDGDSWIDMENENQQTFSVIIDKVNCHYWWRVVVRVEE